MAITNAQQTKQMLQDGGMLVKPRADGKRPGYYGPDAGHENDPGHGSNSGNNGGDNTNRERGIMSRGKGPKGTTGNIGDFEDTGPDRSRVGQFSTYGKNVMAKNLTPPSLLSKIGGGIKDYVTSGGLLGAGLRGFMGLFGGPKGFSTQGDPYGNAPGGIHDYSSTDDDDDDQGGGDGGVIPLYAQLGFPSQAAYLASLQRAQTIAASAPTTTQQPGIAYRFMADGGIANTEVARQNYFIGGIIKKATKAVKKIGSKVNRARKKVLKNPYVQTAIALYAPYAIGSTGFMAGASPFMRQAAISGLTQGGLQLASGQDLDAKGILRSAALSGALATMSPAQGAQQSSVATDASRARVASDIGSGGITDLVNPNVNIDEFATSLRGPAEFGMSTRVPVDPTIPFGQGDIMREYARTAGTGVADTAKAALKESSFMDKIAKTITDNKAGNFLLGDGEGGISALKAIGIASALPLLGVGAPEEEDEGEPYRGEGIDIAAIRRNPYSYTAPRFMAEGGSAEPVAKKVMPLLDMGGQEMDLRAEGGFVPIGRMEKADDVPARLSKNEFVFTADAVRNAGEGDVDKGAEVMYNMMKNLESGGDVSEESQGLDGAKQMFQTSQRLGEVI